jgi:two-component system sensor histidine kinase KdpD
MDTSRRLSQPWIGYASALALTGVVTGVVAAVRAIADVGNASMLYLLAVLVSAVAFGAGPAIAASLASFLAFNFFFIEPHHTLTVADDDQWVALALLLVTGLVTGQLAVGLRQRAREAERREKEAVVLYDVVRLIGDPDMKEALGAVAEKIRLELGLDAVLIGFGAQDVGVAEAEAGDSKALSVARSAAQASEVVLSQGATPTRTERGAPGRWIRVVSPSRRRWRMDRTHTVPIQAAQVRVGAIVLVRGSGSPDFTTNDDRLLSAVANQLGLAVERLRLREEATDAEVLRRTDELRTALMNAVSHDLRTPLSSIVASAGSLLQEEVAWTDEQRREFARVVLDEAERLNRVVGNLLDLSRIRAGAIRPEKGWYDLGSLVTEVVGRFQRTASGRVLTVDLPEDLPPVEFDYVEIDQVLSNLIENASRHTPATADICISIRLQGEEAEVTVADSGPGVPEDALQRLFTPFYAGPSRDGPPRGSGLGLAIARGLVEAHGGRIWAENRPEGGARFVFTLPLTREPAAS